MQRYILTGTPGSGKTTIIRELQSRGYELIKIPASPLLARVARILEIVSPDASACHTA
jgi:predicted ATPase